MFPDRKVFGNTRQKHNENGRKDIEEKVNELNRNKFSASDCVITCQQMLSLNEKRNKLLKLLENGYDRNESLGPEEIIDIVSDGKDKTLKPEEKLEVVNLPLEISEEEEENEEEQEEEKDSEHDWREVDDTQCTLDGVCGLGEIKESLFNILIYPSLYPHFFPRKIRWNQILLFGPPGTGKTLLAKALAREINGILHRVTSADLLSHWQGQTEKQIRNLFQEIQSNPVPKILFFDEIDGLFRKRTNEESDSTRRIKTELLIHLDDFTADFENHQTFLIGATNCPWEIDSSFMRRFHKKIFVPLPDKKARLDIIKKSFENIETDLTDLEWNEIGDRTEGYSGSELVNIVMTSCCERFMEMKRWKYWEQRGGFWIPVSSDSLYSTEMNFEDINPEEVGVRNIVFFDLVEAILKTPKTIEPEKLLKYFEFSEKNMVE